MMTGNLWYDLAFLLIVGSGPVFALQVLAHSWLDEGESSRRSASWLAAAFAVFTMAYGWLFIEMFLTGLGF